MNFLPEAPSRRAVMTLALTLGTAAVAAPMAAASSKSIEDHWTSLKEAYVEIYSAPADDDDEPYWRRIDAASGAMHRSRPTTTREAEIYLWCGILNNGNSERWIEQAIIREDLACLSSAADEMRLDSDYLFFVRSLEGLRLMQGRGQIA